jgi:hypothetical protein
MTSILIRERLSQARWLMPVILATWEAEITRITVRVQLEQNVVRFLPSPHSHHHSQTTARYGGTCLSFKLLWKLRCGGWWFQSSPAKKFLKPHLDGKKKKKERKKAGHSGLCLSSQL